MADTAAATAFQDIQNIQNIQDTQHIEVIEDPFLQLWRDSAERFWRAREQMARAMLDAAKSTIAFTQKLVEHRLGTIREAGEAEDPAHASLSLITGALQEIEGRALTIRQITKKIRHGLREASKFILSRQKQPKTQHSETNPASHQTSPTPPYGEPFIPPREIIAFSDPPTQLFNMPLKTAPA